MKKMLTSLGVDLSTSATGLVLLRETGDKIPETLLAVEVKPKPVDLRGAARARLIATEVMTVIHEHRPDKIVVEGYSLNLKNKSSVVPLVELGGVVRLMMHLDGLHWYDPKANEVKEFVTGKGNSPKSTMMMHVLKRWGYESATDNIADGYGLACMGLAQANRLPGVTQRMRAITGGMAMRKF